MVQFLMQVITTLFVFDVAGVGLQLMVFSQDFVPNGLKQRTEKNDESASA